jgi:branched-chain amino acid transport system substrate-binding protein
VEPAAVKGIIRSGAALIAVALCFGSGAVVEAQKPIRVGVSPSLTGTYAAIGQNLLRGYELCVKHTNDKGGVLERKLELVFYDNRSDLNTAVLLYEKLFAQDKVRS